MEVQELDRIVDELCDDLRHKLKDNVRHFESDWDGKHLRALAAMIIENNWRFDSVKRAATQIKKSATIFKLHI